MKTQLQNIARQLILLFIFPMTFAAPVTLSAQKVDMFQTLKTKYPDEDAVFISRKHDIAIKLEKDKPVIYDKVHEDLLMLTGSAAAYAEQNIYWSDFSEISNLNARTLIPSGRRYRSVKVTDVIPSNEIADGAFYDDSKAFKVEFPSLVKGARTVIGYTEKINDPHLYGRYFFYSYAPAGDVEYSITFPPQVKLRYRLFPAPDSAIHFTCKTSRRKTTLTWKLRNAPKIKPETGAPAMGAYIPNLVVMITGFETKTGTVEVLPDVASLYEWYYNLVKNVNRQVSPDIKQLVDSITAGANDSLEKVRRIFKWVENNITYIGYEDSLQGMIPRDAALVCRRRFGDCKDMASTLTEMIRAAGLPAFQTWLGTRDISYSFSDVPSPMSANHMICTYMQDGKYYFLDATGKEAPFGLPTAMIQGKQALIGMGPGKFKLVTIPETDMNTNLLADTSRIILVSKPGAGDAIPVRITGRGTVYSAGYNKMLLVERLRTSDKKEKQDLAAALLQKGNNKFFVDSLTCRNMDESDMPLIMNYSFGLDNYAEGNGNELYVNLNLEKAYMNNTIEKDRQAPVAQDYKNIETGTVILAVPQGYKITFLPKNSSYTAPRFGYSIQYSLQGDTVVEQRQIYINTLTIEPADFAAWNAMINQLTKAYGETVGMEKE